MVPTSRARALIFGWSVWMLCAVAATRVQWWCDCSLSFTLVRSFSPCLSTATCRWHWYTHPICVHNQRSERNLARPVAWAGVRLKRTHVRGTLSATHSQKQKKISFLSLLSLSLSLLLSLLSLLSLRFLDIRMVLAAVLAQPTCSHSAAALPPHRPHHHRPW